MLATAERHTAASPAPPSRPRLRLQPDLSARTLLDGGWWPRSADLAADLPEPAGFAAWPDFGLTRPLNSDKQRKVLSKSSQVSPYAGWSRRGVKIPTDQMIRMDTLPGEAIQASRTFQHCGPDRVRAEYLPGC